MRHADVQADRSTLLGLGRNLPITPGETRYAKYYEANPVGPPLCMLACEQVSGRVVGMGTMFPSRLRVHGRSVDAAIDADFAIDAEHRGFGPALLLQRALLDSARKRGMLCAYGIPNEFSEPIVKRVGYKEVGTLTRYAKPLRARVAVREVVGQPQLARALSALATAVVDPLLPLVYRERRSPAGARFTVEKPAAFDERFAAVWKDLEERHPITGERNAELLNWKFERDPAHRSGSHYPILAVVGEDGQVAGYAVYTDDDDGVRRVLDLGCLDSQPAIDTLLTELLRDSRCEGASAITFSFLGRADLLASRLRSFGFVAQQKDVRLRLVQLAEFPGGVDALDPSNWFYVYGDNDV